MSQSRLHYPRILSQALDATLLVMLLIGQAGFPSAAAPQPPNAAPQPGLRGPQPFATILCKFADIPAEPDPVAYFEQLMGGEYPGLDHYWREASYGAISLEGSRVMGWFELPQPQDAYRTGVPMTPLPSPTPSGDLQRLAEDCTAAAGESVDWTRFAGLNLVFNADLDRPRGGKACLNLTGETVCYQTTWLWPRWYHNQSIWAHEMGHAFGLQHSSAGSGYENVWDVMSVDGSCRVETRYGRIGQHPSAFQKDLLKWIPEGRVFTAGSESQRTITLEQIAMPKSDGYLLARIPIRIGEGQGESAGEGRRYYTVETRRRAGYDAALMGEGIVIHEVDLDSEPQGWPVSVVQAGSVLRKSTIPGPATRLLPGQLFHDERNRIAISVDRATVTGFVVTLFTGPLPAALSALEWKHVAANDVPHIVQSGRQAGMQISITTIASADLGDFVAWKEHNATHDALMSTSTATPNLYFAYRSPGGDWGEHQQINDDSRDSRSQPTLAIDRQGNAYAVWVDYRDGNAALYAAARPDGGVWGKNIKLSSGSPHGYVGLTLIVDWEDQVHVLWQGVDQCGGDEVVLGEGE